MEEDQGMMMRKSNGRYITEEILHQEILVRLPVKSLVRFKSVSKSWRSLMHSRSFIDLYRRRHCHDYSGQLIYYNIYTSSYNALTVTNSSPLKVVSTVPSDLNLPPRITSLISRGDLHLLGHLSNGIYCCFGESGDTIALFNPATREYKLSKTFPCKLIKTLVYGRGPKPCQVNYGFGSVDHKDGLGVDYKVVVFVGFERFPFSSCLSFVYSLRHNKWRKIVDYEHGKRDRSNKKAIDGLIIGGRVNYPSIIPDLEVCPQRFFKGCWHWMALGRDFMYTVLSFNMADDAFKLMGGPKSHKAYDLNVKCGVLVLNDHLAAIYVSRSRLLDQSMNGNFDVLMMMEYGVEESWTKIYSIKPGFYGIFWKLVGISITVDEAGDNGIQSILFEDSSKELIFCDSTGFKKHCTFHNISSRTCLNTLGISTYLETLEPLNDLEARVCPYNLRYKKSTK